MVSFLVVGPRANTDCVCCRGNGLGTVIAHQPPVRDVYLHPLGFLPPAAVQRKSYDLAYHIKDLIEYKNSDAMMEDHDAILKLGAG